MLVPHMRRRSWCHWPSCHWHRRCHDQLVLCAWSIHYTRSKGSATAAVDFNATWEDCGRMGVGGSWSGRRNTSHCHQTKTEKKERKECKQVTLVKWLIAWDLLDTYVFFLKKHSSRSSMALPNTRIWPLDSWKISFYYMDLGSLGSLITLWSWIWWSLVVPKRRNSEIDSSSFVSCSV